MNNKYKELWFKLFDYLSDRALTISPADLEEGCEKCHRKTQYAEIRSILMLMIEEEEKFNEKRN